jgi:hypothetical protein
MAERLVALTNSEEEARAALEELARSGVSRSDVTVISSEPLHGLSEGLPEGLPEGKRHKSRSLIGLFAVGGGVLGALVGIMLTVSTSKSVGLITGGMPVVSPWAFGVIVFELTALGAILASLLRLIIEAGLVRRSPRVAMDQVAEGRIALSIECGSADRGDVERALANAGAEVMS